MKQKGLRAKPLRPSLWRALLTLTGPRSLAVILTLAFRRGGASFSQPKTVRIRPLDNQPVRLRPKTSDGRVVLDVFVGLFHLPPADLEEPLVIWDLGSNIGLTVAHYAALFPTARVTGLEPDPPTAEMARENIAPWGERCSIVTGAAWSSDGELTFEREAGEEFGAHVVEHGDDSNQMQVAGYSLSTLLRDEEVVDFMKVDIEGAEHEIFTKNTEWADKVKCLNVEIHPPHTIESITKDLEQLGYAVDVNRKHWASVIARKPTV